MVDALAMQAVIVAGIYTASIFAWYYVFEDFTGIILGVASAAATNYLFRKALAGIAKSLVAGG